jgi:hypothetical protein
VTAPPAPGLAETLDQLLNPRVVRVDRLGATDPDVAALEAEHDAHSAALRAQHADLQRRHHAAQARRVLARLIAHERRRQARTAASTALPSLLDQLCDAVQSTSGGGGAAAGPHRAAIGLAAAELLGQIERAVGHGPRVELGRRVWTWAKRHAADPTTAHTAAAWLAVARGVLEPERPLGLVAACPQCRARLVYVEDAGEWVRRPALQVDRRDGTARCTAPQCGAIWPPAQLPLLAAVLEQQSVDEAGEQGQRQEGSAA